MSEPVTYKEHFNYFMENNKNEDCLLKWLNVMEPETAIVIIMLVNNGCPVSVVLKTMFQIMENAEDVSFDWGDEND